MNKEHNYNDIIKWKEHNYNDIIKWKEHKSNELKTMDFLQLIDLIIEKESYKLKINKKEKDKWKNDKYVQLKMMKLEDLHELFLNHEISKMSVEEVKKEISTYEKEINDKISLQYKITDNSKVKVVEYMFDGDELKFWDANDSDNHDEIDLNEYINWNEVNEKAITQMKEYFKKGTKFIDIDDEHDEDDKS